MELAGKHATVLGGDGYHELEFWYPVLRLREEGADVVIAAPDGSAKYNSALGYPLMPHCSISDVDAAATDILVIPGSGAAERLQAVPETAKLAATVHEHGGVVAVIGAGVLIAKQAGLLRGRRVACPPELAKPVAAAGATADSESDVVADERLISVSQANDLPALLREVRAHATAAAK